MAWLTGWNRRKLITVNGTTAGIQSDYQMLLTLNQGSGADSVGTVYLGGNVLSTPAFADIRFTKSDGSTILNYWIESTTGTSPNQTTKVWVKLAPSPDTIPVSSGTYSFYIYYNNPSAASLSSGTNTFVFFDDFSSGTINSTWNFVGGSWQQIGGILRQTSTNLYNKYAWVNLPARDFIVNVKVRPDSLGGSPPDYRMGLLARTNGISAASCGGHRAHCFVINRNNQSQVTTLDECVTWGSPISPGFTFSTGSWYNFEILASLSNNTSISGKVWRDGTNEPGSWQIASPFSSQTNKNVGLNGGGGSTVSFDDFRIRNYVSPEPSWGSVGTEQLSTYCTPFDITSNPTGAEVYLAFPSGSGYVDQHLLTKSNICVPTSSTTYDLKLTKGGYQDYMLTNQSYTPGQPQSIQATLNKIDTNIYVTKILCGNSSGSLLASGKYYTSVNIHNPNNFPVTFTKKSPKSKNDIIIQPDSAVEIDCVDIRGSENIPDTIFVSEFLVIESANKLDVLVVYTVVGTSGQVSLEIVPVFPTTVLIDII